MVFTGLKLGTTRLPGYQADRISRCSLNIATVLPSPTHIDPATAAWKTVFLLLLLFSFSGSVWNFRGWWYVPHSARIIHGQWGQPTTTRVFIEPKGKSSPGCYSLSHPLPANQSIYTIHIEIHILSSFLIHIYSHRSVLTIHVHSHPFTFPVRTQFENPPRMACRFLQAYNANS